MWFFEMLKIAGGLALLALLHLIRLASPKLGDTLSRKFDDAVRKTAKR